MSPIIVGLSQVGSKECPSVRLSLITKPTRQSEQSMTLFTASQPDIRSRDGRAGNVREAQDEEAQQAEPGGPRSILLEVQPGGNQKHDQVEHGRDDDLGDGDAHKLELFAGGEAPALALLDGDIPEGGDR